MERRQSRVRKMLNAANLRWLAVYSLRKEKAAKEDDGAEAGLPWLSGWAVCDPAPPALSQDPQRERGVTGPRHRVLASLVARPQGGEHEVRAGLPRARGRSVHPDRCPPLHPRGPRRLAVGGWGSSPGES